MKYFLCFAALLLGFLSGEAQFTVRFKLGKYPLQHAQDSIFIAGNFNSWNPHNSAYVLSQGDENILSLYTKLPAGEYEFKCTRGNWKKVECQDHGYETENREIEIFSDTSIEINIEAWKDDFTGVSRRHTAGKQVHIMDTAFYMPQLQRYRRIWVYLPEGYANSKKHYPVLYMQDGQNLFDAATSAFGEWGVDECLDTLIRSGKQASIVVGIDNGPQRLNEYNPYEFQNFGKGEADQYLAFLTETLKPFIDKQYRTLPGKENTLIAGSSSGALLAYYAMLKQPGIFGKAGIFSPAFWTAPGISSLTDSLSAKNNGKFFFYIGEHEGASFVNDMQKIQEALGERSAAQIYAVIDAKEKHNEKAWRKWFPEFYCWIMADGFNYVIKTGE
ncbi:MAG: alpha/beta hydrolase [Ferruginibacter sp.]